VFFNLNGKLGCKALSSLKVLMYIYARLVAHLSFHGGTLFLII
jgi:hypothetical protein